MVMSTPKGRFSRSLTDRHGRPPTGYGFDVSHSRLRRLSCRFSRWTWTLRDDCKSAVGRRSDVGRSTVSVGVLVSLSRLNVVVHREHGRLDPYLKSPNESAVDVTVVG